MSAAAGCASTPSTLIAAGKLIDREAGPEPSGGWRSTVPTRCCTRATARSGRFEIGLSGGQLIEQCLGLPQVERVETLGEPAVDRGENVTRLGAATLFRPEAGECGRRP